MVLVALFIGAILIVAAIRNSQGTLFSALYKDVPGYVVWAAAIFAIGAIGFIPGLKPVSRGLLALVIVVIVMRNYKQILAGFQNAWTNPPAAVPNSPSNGSAASGAPNNGTLNNLLGSQDWGSVFGSFGSSGGAAADSSSFIDAGTAADAASAVA